MLYIIISMSIQGYQFDPNEFPRLRTYYYSVLDLRRDNASLGEIPNANYCTGDMFSIRKDWVWTPSIDTINQCCAGSNFSVPLYHKLSQSYGGSAVASLFVFCKVYLYYSRGMTPPDVPPLTGIHPVKKS